MASPSSASVAFSAFMESGATTFHSGSRAMLVAMDFSHSDWAAATFSMSSFSAPSVSVNCCRNAASCFSCSGELIR